MNNTVVRIGEATGGHIILAGTDRIICTKPLRNWGEDSIIEDGEHHELFAQGRLLPENADVSLFRNPGYATVRLMSDSSVVYHKVLHKLIFTNYNI